MYKYLIHFKERLACCSFEAWGGQNNGPRKIRMRIVFFEDVGIVGVVFFLAKRFAIVFLRLRPNLAFSTFQYKKENMRIYGCNSIQSTKFSKPIQ